MPSLSVGCEDLALFLVPASIIELSFRPPRPASIPMAFAARSRLFCEREGSALRDLRLVVGIKIAERPPMTQEKPSEGVGGNACASRAWKGNNAG